MPESDAERNARLGVRARTWAHASSRKRSAPSRDAVEFRVVSYNTLACGYDQMKFVHSSYINL